ncbi:MAG: hypothetical protein KKB30_07175 [Proteobacteria bacterium]|nr:hypothetical protein [Pseudomonadota bacterium]MBU1714212.1 hypothetical protein [Pseudomonadota bacterium]
MNTSVNFRLADLKPVQPIQGWEEFLGDGDRFLKTAIGAHTKGRPVFTSEILYNLIAMAIEKFVMASLMQRGKLPYNHTMRDLVEAIDETFPGGINEIREGLLEFDKYQDICDLEGFSIVPPGMARIPAMLCLGEKMQTFAHAL